MLYQIFIALSSFILTLLGTRLLIIRLREKPWLMDLPNARSNHKIPTPKGGGITILITIAAYFFATDANFTLIAGLLVLGGVSLIDDWAPISPISRLASHILVVSAMVSLGNFSLGLDFLPVAAEKTLIILLWVWFINLYNFMDGIDGIAASESMCITLGICFVLALNGHDANPIFLNSLIVATATAGFLWWNWHPAKIFLGDVGSIPLGFVVGYFLLKLSSLGFAISALILCSYFLMDASFTLIKRIIRGEKIWLAHSEHYYQLAVRSGASHSAVTTNIVGVNIMLIALAIMAAIFPDIAIFALLAAFIMVFVLLIFFERLFQKKKTNEKTP